LTSLTFCDFGPIKEILGEIMNLFLTLTCLILAVYTGCSCSKGGGDDAAVTDGGSIATVENAPNISDFDGSSTPEELAVMLSNSNLSCSSGQTLKFDGTNWVCGDDSFASLNCPDDHTVVYTGGNWECRSGASEFLQTNGTITMYVSPTGSDTDNDCLTSGSPCATVAKALKFVPLRIQHAITINLAPGTYTEAFQIDGFAGGNKSLTIQGDGGIAIFDGQGTTPIMINVNNSVGVFLDNIAVTDTSSTGIEINESSIWMKTFSADSNGNDGMTISYNSIVHLDDNSNLSASSNGRNGITMEASTLRGVTITADIDLNGNQASGLAIGTGSRVRLEVTSGQINVGTDASKNDLGSTGQHAMIVSGNSDVRILGPTATPTLFRSTTGIGVYVSESSHFLVDSINTSSNSNGVFCHLGSACHVFNLISDSNSGDGIFCFEGASCILVCDKFQCSLQSNSSGIQVDGKSHFVVRGAFGFRSSTNGANAALVRGHSHFRQDAECNSCGGATNVNEYSTLKILTGVTNELPGQATATGGNIWNY